MVIGLLILSTALLLPVASGQPSSDCYHIAYTVDSTNTHYSLVKNDSYLIGQTLIIEGNCPITYKTSNFQITEDNIIIQTVPLELDDFTIIQNNQTILYSNLTIFPSNSFDFEDFIYNEDLTISESKLWTSELLSHGITAFIIYTLSTSVVYRLAKNKVDNSIEVVI